MTDIRETTPSAEPSAWRVWFRDRRPWLFVGLVVIPAALWLGWDWLAAVGALPVLLALAPCIAVCALGLCMRRGAAGTCELQAKGLPTKQIKS